MELTIIQYSVTLFEIICVIIVFASIFMRSRFFNEVIEHHPAWTTQILLVVFFGILSIFGTISGLSIYGAVVNVRDLGPMAAGMVCGPYIGIGAGIIGGLFRFFQGGPYMWTGLSAPLLSGVLGGIIYLANKRQFVPTWVAVLLIGLSETLISCYTLILVTKPSEFFTVVTTVAIPMVVFNVIGMFIFATVIHHTLDERKAIKKIQVLEREVESKRNLFAIINTLSYPVYVLDRDNRFNIVNDSMCSFIGRSREEILERTPRDFFPDDDSAFHGNMTGRVFRNQTTREDEVTITKPDGQKCTIISTSTLYTDASGQRFLVGAIQDITGRKMAEESLHLFKDLVEHSSDAIGMSTPEGRHYYQNESFNRLFGDIGDNPPDSVYADKAIGKEVFDTIIGGGIWQGEVKMFGKDQTILDIFLRAYTIRNQDGRVIGLVGLHTDITERRQAEEALKESEEKFRVVFENANDSILLIAISPNGLPEKIVEVNETACRRMKYTREEFLRLLLREIDAPETWEKIHINMKNLMEKGHATFEGVHVTKDGERIHVEISAHTFNLHGQGLVLAHVRDITERKRVEEAVRASENRYRTILENTGTAINLIEEDTRISVANAEFTRLSGYSKEEIEGKKNWTEFIVKEDLERMLAQDLLMQMNKDAALKHYEFGFITKTGEIRTIFLTVEKIPGTKQVVASLMDITERKQAEKDLRESEVKYRTILDNIQDVFYRSDRDGNLIMMSPSGAKLLGVISADELLGLNIAEQIYANPGERTQLLDMMEKNGFVEDYEVGLKRKDGSVVSVSTDSHYYFDASGNPLGVEGIFRDISERKRAEDALKVSERTMKDIISFLPDATLVIDKTGVVLAWNHAMEEMTGVPAEQMIGKGNYEYALPLYHERRPITIDLVLHDDPAVAAKYPVMKKDGNTRFSEIFIPHLNKGRGAHLWFAATPLYDADRNLTGAIESIRDITALKQADEQLHLLLREKEILLREIHHRVGNIMQMAVSMMKMEARRENDKRVRDLILVIRSRLDAIASTFGTLYLSDNMSLVNFQNVIRSIVSSLQSAYESGEHPLQIDIHMDLPELGVDLALPLALITNELVNNALRHAFPERRDGTVTITGTEDGNGWIILTVSDNGQGLDEGIKPAESDTIGFTLVNLLLGQVGGTADYTSSRNGTTFTIRVPRDAERDKSGVNER
ncbi:PAS domain S-box protein [Methanoregula sp.]|uniref:PAS domain S-box protein n=1 Tax=Methanoregula sp. TaxID=2052170 RepID=UPI002374EBE6|nr:PAS domain S-box protein [Methanoregula sp.]MDD1685876.1 PAS domain S-box protein [Methanoregula sp.]